MASLLFFVFSYFVLCVCFFEIVQKPFFYLYNRKAARRPFRLGDLPGIYSHGFMTDLIVASYLSAIPLLAVCVYACIPCFGLYAALACYNVFVALLVSLTVVADTLLYRFWNFKIDASVFVYLRSLKGSFASVSAFYVVSSLVAVLAVGALFFCGLQQVSSLYCNVSPFVAIGWASGAGVSVVFILCGLSLFAVIRGFGIRPNTPSIAYYSNVPFCNHCAVNPAYNLLYSMSSGKEDFGKQFRFFPQEYCESVFKPLFPVAGVPQVRLLNAERPNVLLIVWESLSARYAGVLGGRKDVLVRFDRLAEEGVLFTRCDAGSFRTDRGLVCLLSGYLGQPTTSVIRYARKLPNLPALPRVLKEHGYSTMALHGGDLSIMHKADYYLASGHDCLVSQRDFPSSAPKGKWGVNDGYIFSWLFDDIQRKTEAGTRWFTTFQTLSSHEPFDVPYGKLPGDLPANSFAYVDECFGKFVDSLKRTPAWDNLLIICTGDHGSNFGTPVPRDEYVHIPLLMLGGAVKRPMRIDKIMGQTDLAATLLGQMGIGHEDFVFSRDVLADTYTHPFSFHSYNNGFLLRDAAGFTDYDNVAGRAVEGTNEEREKMGKAILQTLYDDLNRR